MERRTAQNLSISCGMGNLLSDHYENIHSHLPYCDFCMVAFSECLASPMHAAMEVHVR